MYHTSHVSPSLGSVVVRNTPFVGGAVLTEDCVVRFRKVQVIVNEREESAIAAFWVSDGWIGIASVFYHDAM